MPVQRSLVRVLLVEDSTAQARFIQHTLGNVGHPIRFEVKWVERLDAALQYLGRTPADLVLLDLMLPDSEGIATFSAVQAAHPELAIIVLSGAGDETTALRAVAEGAQDYIAKSIMSPEMLSRSIRYAVERHRTLEDLRRLALVDDLTGGHNRRGFMLLGEELLGAARRGNSSVTAIFVDVDGLKRVNDGHGHQEGDRVLADVARILRTTFRARDVTGRIGGDEFCVLILDDPEDAQPAELAARRLRAAIDEHNREARGPVALSCSIGVVSRRSRDATVLGLLSEADRAMYEQRPPFLLPNPPPGEGDGGRSRAAMESGM